MSCEEVRPVTEYGHEVDDVATRLIKEKGYSPNQEIQEAKSTIRIDARKRAMVLFRANQRQK